jgi:hypothetical protein
MFIAKSLENNQRLIRMSLRTCVEGVFSARVLAHNSRKRSLNKKVKGFAGSLYGNGNIGLIMDITQVAGFE